MDNVCEFCGYEDQFGVDVCKVIRVEVIDGKYVDRYLCRLCVSHISMCRTNADNRICLLARLMILCTNKILAAINKAS